VCVCVRERETHTHTERERQRDFSREGKARQNQTSLSESSNKKNDFKWNLNIRMSEWKKKKGEKKRNLTSECPPFVVAMVENKVRTKERVGTAKEKNVIVYKHIYIFKYTQTHLHI